MKKQISILLTALYIFTALQISEYIKLPVLISHFVEHQSTNPNIKFLDFISMHYTENESSDPQKHDKLPFKSHHTDFQCSSNVTFFVAIQNINFETVSFINEYKKPAFGYSFVFLSNFHSSIWQPPKIC